MRATGSVTNDDPYADETARRMASRAPAGLLFFLGCVLISTVFEIARFPVRQFWMLSFAAGFVVASAACWLALRRYPTKSVVTLVVFVNLVGGGLNAYHALVGAPVAMCLWTVTGLLCSAAVILQWRGPHQAFASLGSLLLYPVHLVPGHLDVLTWAAGGTYLVVMVGMSIVGANLYAAYARRGLQMASALTEREARLQSYFDLAPVGTAVLRADGTFSEVNDALCRVLRHSAEELLQMGWFEIPHHGDRHATRDQVTRALAGTAPVPQREMRLVRKDGIIIHAAVDVRGLPGPLGAIDHLMVLVEDITERKHAEQERERLLACELDARLQAEAASRAKDEFLATLSHELRTPLSPILAWSDLLRRHELTPDQTDRGLAAIARNAAAQARLIDELLDISRIVSGKVQLDPRPVDLGVVILEAVDVMRSTAEAKGIDIATTIDAAVCRIMGDADRLRQVLWNLLSNAVKFTPAGGNVTVTLRRAGGYALITVADTGQGIPASFLPLVFERFRQVDTSATRRHGGLGIGLAIVRELVELHRGRVVAESAGEGRGSVFTVEIPLLVDSRPAETAGASRATNAALDGVQVLVVDDDADSNDVVRTLLASRGADVRTAGSVAEALAMLEGWVPHVVVSDIAMPGEDGYALLARMRARGLPLGAVPAIALTAYSAPRDRERALSSGFRAHVTKPISMAELIGAVREARDASTVLH